jgi:hypothetical protein
MAEQLRKMDPASGLAEQNQEPTPIAEDQKLMQSWLAPEPP